MNSVSNISWQSRRAIQTSSSSKTISNRKLRSRAAPSRAAVSTLGYVESRQIICAISESRGLSHTVGLAFVDLETSQAILCQLRDTQTYVRTVQKLHVYRPSEIVLTSSAFIGDDISKLVSIIQDNLDDLDCVITPLDRRYWNENIGLEYIQRLAFVEDLEPIRVAIAGSSFAICCLAAVLKYVEDINDRKFCSHTLHFKVEASQGSMMIDVSTMTSFELVQNLQAQKSKHCLFGRVNNTLTAMGSRLLRSSIMQPLTNSETLTSRYDALEEMTTKENLFVSVSEALKGIQDVDKFLTNLNHDQMMSLDTITQKINNIIMLKAFLLSIETIYKSLNDCESGLLSEIRQLCHPQFVDQIAIMIENVINEDIKYSHSPLDMRNNQVFAVKAGVSSLLDVTRQAYKENCDDVYSYVDKLASAHDLPLQLKYDASRQFFLAIPDSQFPDLVQHAEFINIVKKRSCIEMSTLNLLKKNEKIVDSYHETVWLSSEIVESLVSDIRQYMSVLFKISEAIATLDMIYAFVHFSISHKCVRPQLGDNLAIRACRHPIKEKLLQANLIANDVFASHQSRFQIVTGCNMSGKSTYIRAVALTVILAQIGCFVPATYAMIPIHHRMFGHISVDDSALANVSTFAAEMQKAAFILRNLDKQSIVIIDELGRGTSSRDGVAIATAIAETLIDSGAFVWFATHFLDLPKVLACRNGAISLHLNVANPDANTLHMRYTISPGPAPDFAYGLAIAKIFPFPGSVCRTAQFISELIREHVTNRKREAKNTFVVRRRRLIFGLKEHLVQVKEGNLIDKTCLDWLELLRNDFVEKMSDIASSKYDLRVPNDLDVDDNEWSGIESEEHPDRGDSSGQSIARVLDFHEEVKRRPKEYFANKTLTSSSNTSSTEMLIC